MNLGTVVAALMLFACGGSVDGERRADATDPAGDVVALSTGQADPAGPPFIDLTAIEGSFRDDGRGPSYRFYLTIREALRVRTNDDPFQSLHAGVMIMAADGSGAPDTGSWDTGAFIVYLTDFTNSLTVPSAEGRSYDAVNGWQTVPPYNSFTLLESGNELSMSPWLADVQTIAGSEAAFEQRAVDPNRNVRFVGVMATDLHYDTVEIVLAADLDF
jgi:hypothetical protein